MLIWRRWRLKNWSAKLLKKIELHQRIGIQKIKSEFLKEKLNEGQNEYTKNFWNQNWRKYDWLGNNIASDRFFFLKSQNAYFIIL